MAEIGFVPLVFVFVGGGIGALVRYTIGKFSQAFFGAYPYGTLLANLLGAALTGVAFVLIYERRFIQPPYNDLVLAGFLGGLTTFSSLILDCYALTEHGALWIACVYLFLNIALGISLFMLAQFLTRMGTIA